LHVAQACFSSCTICAVFINNLAATFLHDWSRLAPRLLQHRPRWPPGSNTGTTAESPAHGGETRARPETTQPCNSCPSGVALASIVQRIEYKLCLFVHKVVIGQAPDYIIDLLTLVTNIPSRSSLRASSNGDLFQPRTEQRIGNHAFCVTTARAWNRLPTELKLMRSSTATFRRHLFFFTPRTDYVMHLRADCRRRTTNSAVTVNLAATVIFACIAGCTIWFVLGFKNR